MQVSQRQTVNIATNLSEINSNKFVVPLNLRFAPHEVIVRSLVYSGEDNVYQACQVYSTNLIDDHVLCHFATGPSSITINLDHRFTMHSGFQMGAVNFQVQFVPTATQGNTGCGSLVDASVQGILSLMLEFLEYDM